MSFMNACVNFMSPKGTSIIIYHKINPKIIYFSKKNVFKPRIFKNYAVTETFLFNKLHKSQYIWESVEGLLKRFFHKQTLFTDYFFEIVENFYLYITTTTKHLANFSFYLHHFYCANNASKLLGKLKLSQVVLQNEAFYINLVA